MATAFLFFDKIRRGTYTENEAASALTILKGENTMYMDENPLSLILRETGESACAAKTWGLENHPLAMVYSPLQAWQSLYDPANALQHGTLFCELDKPFLGRRCE